jgi:hypothetical protein
MAVRCGADREDITLSAPDLVGRRAVPARHRSDALRLATRRLAGLARRAAMPPLMTAPSGTPSGADPTIARPPNRAAVARTHAMMPCHTAAPTTAVEADDTDAGSSAGAADRAGRLDTRPRRRRRCARPRGSPTGTCSAEELGQYRVPESGAEVGRIVDSCAIMGSCVFRVMR